MQLGHVFTLANRSMKKPLLAAASVAFSVLVASSSASAFAETVTTEGVWNEDEHQFEFYDSRLNNIDPSKPFFASMKFVDDYFHIAGVGPILTRGHILDVNIDPDNLYLPTSGDSIFNLEQSFLYYNDLNGERVSLAQILGLSGPAITMSEVTFLSFTTETSKNDFQMMWHFVFHNPSYPFIPRATLTYNLNPVPEPETWAMLLAGLGVVGVIARKRQKQKR
jgi:hypothetical protein